MHEHQITAPGQMREFVLAGNAHFTLVSLRTNARFTYRVKKAADGKPLHFCSLLTGPDNEKSYSYFGLIRNDVFEYGRKAKVAETSLGVQAFAWAIARILATQDVPSAEFWHEGRCGRCNRLLTVPESIARGIGPECSNMIGLAGGSFFEATV